MRKKILFLFFVRVNLGNQRYNVGMDQAGSQWDAPRLTPGQLTHAATRPVIFIWNLGRLVVCGCFFFFFFFTDYLVFLKVARSHLVPQGLLLLFFFLCFSDD